MEKLRKLTIVLILISLVMILIPNYVKAAGYFSLNKSSASITTGGTTTITVTTFDCEGKFTVSSSNTSVATVSTSSFWGDSKGTTITVTAKSAGTATITVTPVDVTDTELNDITGAKTCKITVTAPAPKPDESKPSTNTGSTTNKPSTGTTTNKPTTNTGSNNGSSGNSNTSTSKPSNNTTTPVVQKSSNSKLSSLQIEEGVIAPEFSSSVKEYSINVPNEVTKLSISAITDDSKATVKITGNEDLQVGENNIEVTVTAEDGTKTTYKILAKRAQPALNLQALTVAYVDENGASLELLLNPAFSFDIYEYSIDTIIPHTIDNIEIAGTANRENAKIEITGNEELKTGQNDITVKVTVTNEAGLEEQKTYIIKVEKEEAPVVVPLTTMQKFQNWFGGIGSTTSAWITKNFDRIISGMLLIATAAFIGLTIYLAYDYKNYQKVLAKLAELNKANLMERVNVALDPELAKDASKEDIIENVDNTEKTEEAVETEKVEVKTGRGKRFR